jgi:predicted nuclease with TOPRIM domain
VLEEIVSATNAKLQTDLPTLIEQKETLEKDLADVKKAADGILDQWEQLTGEEGAVFLKERLDQLGKRRTEIEAALEELELAVKEVEREAVSQKIVLEALGNFTEVFHEIPVVSHSTPISCPIILWYCSCNLVRPIIIRFLSIDPTIV